MYRICIRGRVTERLGSALEGMRLEAGATETVFTGEIRDQSQLYGLLDRVRDLGLELVSVHPCPRLTRRPTTRRRRDDRKAPTPRRTDELQPAADCVVLPNRHGAAALAKPPEQHGRPLR
jgi:hypothetical protein